MTDELTRDEADAIVTVLIDARTGETNAMSFRYALGHQPELSSAIRKVARLAGTPAEKLEWLLSGPKLLTDPE
jgi:hypothetical protein